MTDKSYYHTMKVFMIFLVLIGFAVTPYLFSNVSAICLTAPDWPDAPCFSGKRGDYPSLNQMRQSWAPYYDFKGGEWMESKKHEMDSVIRYGTLLEWIQLTQDNGTNSNVHRYYFLMGDVPNEDGLFVKEYYGINFLSPLQQSKSGIELNEIHCGINLVLIQKYDGSSACVKPETAHSLEERGWGLSYVVFQDLVENSDAIVTGMVVGVDNRPSGERHVWLGSYEWLKRGIYDEQQLFLEQSGRNPLPMDVEFSKGEEVLLFLKNVDVKRGAYDLISINGITPQKYSILLRDSVWSFFDHNFYKIESNGENSPNCSGKFFGIDPYSYCTTKKSSYVPVDDLMEKVREKMLEDISKEYLEEHFDLLVVYDQPDPQYEPEPNAGPFVVPEKAKRQNIEFVFTINDIDSRYFMRTEYNEDQNQIELQYAPPREIETIASEKEINDLISSCLEGAYHFLYSPAYIGYHEDYGFSPAVEGHGPPMVFDRWNNDLLQDREKIFRIWLTESEVDCASPNVEFDPDYSKRPDRVPLIESIEQ